MQISCIYNQSILSNKIIFNNIKNNRCIPIIGDSRIRLSNLSILFLLFFLTLLIAGPIYRANNQTHKIIDTFLLKATIPMTLTPKERGERSRTPAVFPAGHAATRSPHCFSVGNARARYSHTEPSRAEPRRVARVHNTCLTPARLPQTRTAVREPGGKLFHRCTISDGSRTLHHATQDTRTLREETRRETRGSERMRYARVTTCTRDKQTCEHACINRERSRLFGKILEECCKFILCSF